MKRATLILLSAFNLAIVFYAIHVRAAGSGFPIYFEDSTLVVSPQIINKTTYLPLADIVQHLKIPYTDALSLETFTIRAQNARLVLTRNSGLISVNDQIVILKSPVLRENNQWLVPLDFLPQGLGRITGLEFRNRAGTNRVFVGGVKPSELVMNAQTLGPVTRLTLRSETPIKLSVSRDDAQKRAILKIEPGPIDPLRARLDLRDRLIASIAFDDADGSPKLVVESNEVIGDVRITAAEDNHVYFVDFARTAVTEAAPPPTPPAPSAPGAPGVDARPDPNRPLRGVRVVVIDPGHGGTDAGTAGAGALEKDLTLAIARRLRTALQSRLGATVLLTRDSDVALSNEARSAVANNNQADLFISLHIGYSSNKLDSGSSVYVMKDDFATKFSPTAAGDRLFLPWYMGYRSSRNASLQLARAIQEDLIEAVPGWKFPLRSGPIAVLSSATMPALALELGNLNNSVNTQAMLDAAFQARLAGTIAAAIERYASTRSTPASF